jgi:hypothetical protein
LGQYSKKDKRNHFLSIKTKKVLFRGRFLQIGGADEDRTRDLLHAMEALSQLSYSPNLFRLKLFQAGFIVPYQPQIVNNPKSTFGVNP